MSFHNVNEFTDRRAVPLQRRHVVSRQALFERRLAFIVMLMWALLLLHWLGVV